MSDWSKYKEKVRNTSPEISKDIDEIEEISSEDFKGREQQANEFAAALLLPREPFIRDIGNYADKLPYYIELKKKWKVSIAAMIMRARKLELISYERYQLICCLMRKF